MLIALIAHDKAGAQALRKENRPAHMNYLNTTGAVHMAGPLLDEEGGMIGSLVVLDLPDMRAAEDWSANDPYTKAGLFESVTLREWKRVIG